MSHAHPHVSELVNKFRGKLRPNDPSSSTGINPPALPARSRPPPINYATKPKSEITNSAHKNTSSSSRQTDTFSNSIFNNAIATSPPNLSARAHALSTKSIQPASSTGRPIQTNKFYSNLYLGSQQCQIYPLPYVLKWSGQGLDINHTDETQQVFGPDPNATEAQYFYNPVGIVSLSLTAAERPTNLSLHNSEQFSIGLTMKPPSGQGSISTYVVRGSAFISANYQNLTPEVQSGVMFRNIEFMNVGSGQKWRLLLEDGRVWLLYACGSQPLRLNQLSGGILQATSPWSGLLQITKLPGGDPRVEGLFDQGCGTYAVSMTLNGNVTSESACYRLSIERQGTQPVLMYALPHHVSSFTTQTRQRVYANGLHSQTSGMMTLVSSDLWEMEEPLPSKSQLVYCPEFQARSASLIETALEGDVDQDFDAQIRSDSMYFCGKALNKLAQMTTLAASLKSTVYERLLSILERSMLYFVRNEQQFNLVYENTWGGIVSSQGFTERGDRSDFGNTWYADHHYHWGYHISSAAIYLQLCEQSQYKDEVVAWVKDLIRDVASPNSDQYFPGYRSMDWFVGHSWSTGLYESADGKDEESTSEDYHFTYACYLFSLCIGDDSLRDRSLVQMAVQRHSMQSYMLFTPQNTCLPRRMLANCVSGIRFENKVDYTTWFGGNKEFIHGIQVLPVTPITPFFRSTEFVQNEWRTKLDGLMRRSHQSMESGWKGLLYISLGMIEGEGGLAWEYFTNSREACDGGTCRAWCLAMISSVRREE